MGNIWWDMHGVIGRGVGDRQGLAPIALYDDPRGVYLLGFSSSEVSNVCLCVYVCMFDVVCVPCVCGVRWRRRKARPYRTPSTHYERSLKGTYI